MIFPAINAFYKMIEESFFYITILDLQSSSVFLTLNWSEGQIPL